MRLIVGLGNPGDRYASTRHNIGFMALDRIAQAYGIAVGKKGFQSLHGSGKVGECKVILVKPQTFMNSSGLAGRGLLEWFKIDPERLILIYDDVDLDVGQLRIR